MAARETDLFRMVSTRGPEPVFSIDPTKDVPNADVVELVRPFTVDLAQVDPKIAQLVAQIQVWSDKQLAQSGLAAVRQAIASGPVSTLPELEQVDIPSGDGTKKVRELVASPVLTREFRDIANSWLVLLLTSPRDRTRPEHEDLLRTAHILHLMETRPALLAEPDAIARLRAARVVPPPSWTARGADAEAVLQHHRQQLAAPVRPVSVRAARIAQAKAEHNRLVRQRLLAESILSKSEMAYGTWKRSKPAWPGRQASLSAVDRVSATLTRLAERQPPVSEVVRRGRPVLQLDRGFATELDKLLTQPERRLYSVLRVGLPRPKTHAEHDAGILPDRWIGKANRLCQQIRIWEDEAKTELPPSRTKPAGTARPLVRSVGWGDLIVAKERLVGYEAREVAHIENVMPGETRKREHERTRTVEETIEVETFQEKESERDLQTTDRFELQSATQTTINEQYSIEAGLNTSGKYGLTQVDTSLQAGMQQSKSEARSSAQSLAKEVVSRAVERTTERVRELRRTTVTEQVRELNRHSFANVPDGAGGPAPADISGIYLWLEKLVEVELRQYGTRMLVEFHIPEPALSLLAAGTPPTAPHKPAPFSLSPSDVLPENYLCLAARFGASDVEPPPEAFIQVGYAWASTPEEESDSWGQDARADYIAIPEGYRPVGMTALISSHPGHAEYTDVFMAVGGVVIVQFEKTNYGESGQAPDADPPEGGPMELDFDPSLSWPNGVPVVVRAAGHFDKTLVAEATIRCARTELALDKWKLRTWQRLRSAHEALMQAYRREVEEAAIDSFGTPPVERPEAENRRVENEELRKWAIKAMRLETFDFDAVTAESDGVQEIFPLGGDLMATVARFFEQAFEWSQASYFLYPYYWARRETWQLRAAVTAVDGRHVAFLRAGAARYVVPVTPGYEDRVLRYLEGVGTEVDRLGPPPEGYEPDDPALIDLWLELLLERRPELALGSGTLDVTQGTPNAKINTDSNWHAGPRDLGRELFIGGDRYTIKTVGPVVAGTPQAISLTEPYSGTTDPSVRYATGSVPYGPPWVERIPTSLVILKGRRGDLVGLV